MGGATHINKATLEVPVQVHVPVHVHVHASIPLPQFLPPTQSETFNLPLPPFLPFLYEQEPPLPRSHPEESEWGLEQELLPYNFTFLSSRAISLFNLLQTLTLGKL